MLELRCTTPDAWLEAVLADFDSFLIDHAACERKASATAITFVTHYPDKRLLVEKMLALAAEELDHFRQVYDILLAREIVPTPDEKDAYVRGLRSEVRTAPEHYLLDRLLVAGIVEARGCERFGMIARGIDDPDLATFYRRITASEARHHDTFTSLACAYFPDEVCVRRLGELLDAEALLIDRLKPRPALH